MNGPTEILVLAGGFGTRLRSAVGEVPKPLAPIDSQPFLYFLIENWLRQGVSGLTFLLHHKSEQIESYLEELELAGKFKECRVRTLTEPKPLGTGGAVAFAARHFDLTDSFLVANADTWLGGGIHEISSSKAAAMAVLYSDQTERYGSVLANDDRVLSFQEKKSSEGAGLINAGLYHLSVSVFEDAPLGAFSLETDIFPNLAARGELNSVRLETDFIDIGIPSDYHRFCNWIKSGKSERLCN